MTEAIKIPAAPPSDKFVILDTETSGLPDFKMPADDPKQPRLASVAMIFCTSGLEIERIEYHLIKPDGWVLGAEAAAVNGLTMEVLEERGIPVLDALEIYTKAIDDGYCMVAHNAQFDCKVMRGELRRAGIDDRFELTRNLCTMRKSMGHAIKASGKGGFPKLSDCCTTFGITLEDQHSALGDAYGCMGVFKHLRTLGIDLAPEVHYAREDHPAKTAKTSKPAKEAKEAVPF